MLEVSDGGVCRCCEEMEVDLVEVGRDIVRTGVIGEIGGAVGEGGRSEGGISFGGEEKDVGDIVQYRMHRMVSAVEGNEFPLA